MVRGIIQINNGCDPAAMAVAIAIVRIRSSDRGRWPPIRRIAETTEDVRQADSLPCLTPDRSLPGMLAANDART